MPSAAARRSSTSCSARAFGRRRGSAGRAHLGRRVGGSDPFVDQESEQPAEGGRGPGDRSRAESAGPQAVEVALDGLGPGRRRVDAGLPGPRLEGGEVVAVGREGVDRPSPLDGQPREVFLGPGVERPAHARSVAGRQPAPGQAHAEDGLGVDDRAVVDHGVEPVEVDLHDRYLLLLEAMPFVGHGSEARWPDTGRSTRRRTRGC